MNVLGFAAPSYSLPGRPSPLVAAPGNQARQLLKSALFAGVSLEACGEILGYARRKKFSREELLYSQDQPVDKWIWIERGRVKVTQLGPSGNEVILWIFGPGDSLGEQASASGYTHMSSARAMESCDALIWDRLGIEKVLARCSQVPGNIAGILENRLRELEERFCYLATECVADRLAFILVRLCKSIGKPGKDGIELKLRRQDLAQMTGTTLCTVSRILTKLANLGLVESRREEVVVREAFFSRMHSFGQLTKDRSVSLAG